MALFQHYSASIEAFSNENDEVIVQTPVYFPLFNSVLNTIIEN
ncbi:MAG: hypothetical protein ACNI3H_11995 [Halarcobacter ebronensis]